MKRPVKINEICDELIGQDDKVCSCSVRIAELIKAASQDDAETQSVGSALAVLKKRDSEKE